jgi:tetratricopeptide (TPR) repeat protein
VSTRTSAELEKVGSTVADRYEIEEMLGRGGMAAVYRVRDARTGRAVALKRGYAHDPQRARTRRAVLEREYHTLAQLAHPRIIEVFDYGVDERGPYYTMELLGGGDLSGRGPWPWREACALLRDVASSLSILHSRGLIHRDVSARNVRSAAQGRAKLIDFGAMVPMGVAKDIVGTPPFLPPEALQMQPLDARVDLFALGALGYYLLTGRHAYPARSLADLRDVWRSTPSAVTRFAPDVPPALNLLVLQLLSLDRNSRPDSAPDVMKRLCAIAGLRDEEEGAVSRAYLKAPSLVGRENVLLKARKAMLSLVRGDGASLLIEDVSGSGRSRMLDACVLEAKLIGSVVLRADANDGATDWGVARTLGAQLLELMPQRAREAMRLSRDVLGHVLEIGSDDPGVTAVSVAMPEHNLIIRELRDFVLSLCQGQRIVIAVDDADRIDAPSAALLAALAHKSERNPLLIALCIDSESRLQASAPLRLLRMISTTLSLPALSAEQTESLMRSVFGDTAYLAVVASRVHAISHGSPRAAMELAQHLVSKGLARYEDGAWSLPSQLDEHDLPSSLAASLATRLDELSADARELAESLCLCDGNALTIASYPDLVSHADNRRVFAALDELVAARVLCGDSDRYRFSQRGFLPVLRDAMPAERRARVHARIAELLARSGGDVLARAHHLLHGEREREAIALLSSTDLLARLPPLALLELAVARAEQLALPARVLFQLRVALLSRASLSLAARSFGRAAPAVLAQLEHDSGLERYRELHALSGPERLTQALTDTQRRYLETPEEERVLSVADAIRELARLVGVFCSLAPTTFDLDLLDTLPSLEPLLPLSPALGVVNQLLVAGKGWVGGHASAVDNYRSVLARVSQPDRAGLDEVQHARTRLGVIYVLGLYDAWHSLPSSEEAAQTLELDRDMRVNAWRVRASLQLAQGNSVEARKCQRRGELLALQNGASERYLGSTAGFHFDSHADAVDFAGMEQSLRELELLAAEHPGWVPVLTHSQARYLEVQGDLEGALAAIESGIGQAVPGRHALFTRMSATHVRILAELGRADEAIALGRRYLEDYQREGLGREDNPLFISLAMALSGAGQHAEAAAMMDNVVTRAEVMGRTGMGIGVLYEARAQLAIAARDREAFERYAERCASAFAIARNPALSMKVAALMAAAQRHGLAEKPLPEAERLAELMPQPESEYATLQSRIAECVGVSDRARCALTILLQSLDSFAGYLYGIDDGKVRALAGLPEGARDATMDAWAAETLAAELEAAHGGTMTATAEATDGVDEDGLPIVSASKGFVDQEGRCFEPLLLVSELSVPERAAALLLVQYPQGPRTLSSRVLLCEIADLLLEHGDVTGSPL